MDLKNLLGKLDIIEGSMEKAAKNPTGPKFTGQWKGTDAGTPGKKLVGDSVEPEENILKDLSKGKTPKTKEQELSEEFQAFLEAEFQDTVDKRPARKNSRPARGHKEEPRYTTIKADEAVGQTYTVVIDRKGREKPVTGTMEELLDYFGYTLETGKSYEHEKGHYKINLNPKNAEQLVDALNKAATNAAANSAPSTHYSVGEGQVNESHYKWEITFRDGKQAVYQQNNPHYSDKTAASDIAYSVSLNPGSRVIATKDGKPFEWQALLSEGWESGPEEYKEPYDDADDAYDRMRQEKIDTEAEREWAKLPKVSTYKLTGRGPNMEPNYEFGDEFDSMEKALKYREEIMKDPKTPYPEHIGIRTITRVVNKEQTDEGQDTFNRAGFNPLRDQRDYLEKFKDLWDLYHTPNLDPQTKAETKQRILDLNAEARSKGYIQAESRGHKILATKLKDIERANKFASGELKVPTPQERQAQLKKLEKAKPVKEYGADNVSPYGQPTTDPKQAASVAQATQTIKAATGSTAPTTNIAKAIDAASQGKPVGQQDMKVLEPVMKDVATIAQDPKLAGQFKTLAQQVNQAQLKQQQLAKK